jgi:SSS family solute:Na+ symporter
MGALSIISFAGFTLLVAGVAWYATRGTDEKSADGYYLGGRSLGAITIAGSLLLTNLSAEQIVGLNGQSFSEGILVMAWETLAAIAMILTAIFILPKYMREGITTIPEFIQNRFDRSTKALMSILFLVAYGVVLLPTILYSGSLAFSTMFDLPVVLGMSQWSVIWICVWSIGAIGIVYAIFGGLKAVAVSDLINAVGLLIGGLLIPVFGLMLIGDGDIFAGLDTLWKSNPDKFEAAGGIDSSIPVGTIFTGMMIAQIYYWGTNQSILQRVFGAKSLKEGQKGMMLAAFVKFLIPIIVVLPGILAWHIFEGNLDNPDQAYPALVRKVLPGAFIGFFAAVLFGAVLSSFNSLLNSSATLFGFDLYKHYFKKDATEQQTVKAGKVFGFGLGIISMSIAPFIYFASDGLFAYIQESLGSLSVPIFAVVFIGILTKKVPALGAKIVLTFGVVLYLISQFVLSPIFVEGALAEAAVNGITDVKELGIIKAKAYPHFLHVMGILFVINVLIMLVVGKLYPRTVYEEPKVTSQIDTTPWKYAIVAGIVITLLVLSTYLIF